LQAHARVGLCFALLIVTVHSLPSTAMANESVAQQIADMENMPIYEQMKFNEGLGNLMIKNEPVYEKVRFIRPCYGLLIVYLLLSTLISIPFIKNPNGAMLYLGEHNWIMWLSVALLFLQIAFYLSAILMLTRGMNVLFRGYVKLMNSTPINYIWGVVYVSCFTTVINAALTAWALTDLCFIYVYTLLHVMGLLVYTYAVKNADFKQLYAYLVPVAVAFFTWVLQALFNDPVRWAALILSVFLGWMVVYETQLIFGTKLERGRKYPYQVGMYIMGANEMYFDLFIHFYLGALGLFKTGDLNDPSAFDRNPYADA